MSSKNNVNPDHYKVAGRDRQGETVVHEQERQSMARGESRRARQKKSPPASGRTRPPASTGDEGGGGDER
jgi:hypothetical protein